MTWITKKPIYFFKNLTFQQHFNSDIDANSKISEKSAVNFYQKIENIAEEVPVALVYNGISHTVMMCSPKHLDDFALGFSLAEGIIDKVDDIYGIDIEEVANGIEVQIELSSRCFMRLKQHRRTLAGRTGCGICGTEQIGSVIKKFEKLDRTFQFNLAILDSCLNALYQAQELGLQTGATHAAAFFSPQGELLAIREDVGRHVALDKLLGWRAKQSQQIGFVLVTSRASYEMVQKSIACGVEMLICISAATGLAVQQALESDLTLVGFARNGRATVYCGEHRVFPCES